LLRWLCLAVGLSLDLIGFALALDGLLNPAAGEEAEEIEVGAVMHGLAGAVSWAGKLGACLDRLTSSPAHLCHSEHCFILVEKCEHLLTATGLRFR